MKLQPAKSKGSVLMVCVIAVAIAGLMLASYLNLVASQNLSVARSQAWNAAIPVIEFGVEEALAQLNQNGVDNLSADGWTQNGNQYTKFRAVGDSHVYTVISNTSPPVIYAYGYVPIPLQSSNYIQRLVRVNTTRGSLFSKGILSRGQITMNGNGLVDSFDSTDPNYSTNGQYIASRRKAGGGVASNSGLTNILNTGNATIYGNLDTGPGGTVDIGPNGKVGDLAWVANPNSSGIMPGAVRDDMNVAFPDVISPFNTATAPTGSVGYQYVISSSGNYAISSLTRSLLVRSNVNAVLLVTDNISLNGNDVIQIDPGGSLQIYMQGQTASIGGNGVVNNNSYATNFFYRGMPGNTSLSISGNGTLAGVIYAPKADFTLNGGGTTQTIIGSVVSSTATINGHFQFHYDESLAKLLAAQGYKASSWDEL